MDKNKTEPIDAVTASGEKLELKMYGHMAQFPSRSIMSMLEVANVKYTFEEVNAGVKGMELKEEQKPLNPSGRIPFLLVNGKPLTESAAILRFLASALPQVNSYYSSDIFIAQKIDEALDINATIISPKSNTRMKLLLMQVGGM